MLSLGSKGDLVGRLQSDLVKLGYDVKIDEDYGPRTRAAVLEFQLDYDDIADDGIAGPETLARIADILSIQQKTLEIFDTSCDATTWAKFLEFAKFLQMSVDYGPGRGLWQATQFLVTHGPGALGLKSWKNMRGSSTYPSLHCTSLTNLFLSWLVRRNENYTHAGNVPSLERLVTSDSSVHPQTEASPFRGFSDFCFKITPDGSGARRSSIPRVMDMSEIYDRRIELPTFMVFQQSTLNASTKKWKWWHHTGVLASRNGSLYRLAADGYRDASRGYSASAVSMINIGLQTVNAFKGAVYQLWGVKSHADGSYGDQTKPIASISIEV